MTLEKAIEILDGCIPPPDNKMVDVEHASIAEAWQMIKAEITKGCKGCMHYAGSSYAFYTYPCNECKYHSADNREEVKF